MTLKGGEILVESLDNICFVQFERYKKFRKIDALSVREHILNYMSNETFADRLFADHLAYCWARLLL